MTDSGRREAVGAALVVAVFILIVFWLDWEGYKASAADYLRNHLADHLLAITAIAAGAGAIYYERKLDREFQEQRTEVKSIIESMFTRYIGNWPDHLSEITDLVRDARQGEHLLIFVDHFGYAHFTRNKLFMVYLDELERARKRGVTLKIVFHSQKAVEKSLSLQFEDKMGKPEEEKKLAESYYAMFKHLIPKDSLDNYSEFATAVLYVQARFCASLLAIIAEGGVEVATIESEEPESVFYWLLQQGDNLRSMIFAYSRFSGVKTGYGFTTSDSQLMAIFSRDFERKLKGSRRIKNESELFPAAWDKTRAWEQGRAQAVAPGA